MNDDRHTNLLRFPHQRPQVGQEIWLLSAADCQGHCNGIGAQTNGILDVANPDVVFWVKRGQARVF